eukprot:gene6428-7159_t
MCAQIEVEKNNLEQLYAEITRSTTTTSFLLMLKVTTGVHFMKRPNVNIAWNYMKEALSSIIDRHAPLIKMRVKGRRCPWITYEIKSLMNTRDKILRKARNTKEESDWSLYERLKNSCNNKIKQAKQKYHRDLLIENSRNPNKSWKCIKEIFPSKQPPPVTATTSIDHNKNFQAANSYVSRIFVEKELKSLKRRKAAGWDNFPPGILKDAAHPLSAPLSYLINLSLSTGMVPTDWKVAKVTPIHKGGSTDDNNNFRPISVLSACSKILERAVHKQLIEYLESNSILSENRFGYRKKRSTELATVLLTDKIRKAVDEGNMLSPAHYQLGTCDNRKVTTKVHANCLKLYHDRNNRPIGHPSVDVNEPYLNFADLSDDSQDDTTTTAEESDVVTEPAAAATDKSFLKDTTEEDHAVFYCKKSFFGSKSKHRNVAPIYVTGADCRCAFKIGKSPLESVQQLAIGGAIQQTSRDQRVLQLDNGFTCKLLHLANHSFHSFFAKATQFLKDAKPSIYTDLLEPHINAALEMQRASMIASWEQLCHQQREVDRFNRWAISTFPNKIVSNNFATLKQIDQFTKENDGDFLHGLGEIVGRTITTIGSSGGKLLVAAGRGLNTVFHGRGYMSKKVATGMTQSAGELLEKGGHAIRDVEHGSHPFFGPSSDLLAALYHGA